MKLSRLYILFLVCMQFNASYAGDVPTVIKYNPFIVPILHTEVNDSVVPSDPSKPFGSEINLRAILYDGQASLVQVDNELIGIGEVTQGFRLLSVNEHSAVFIKHGKQIRLSIHDDKSEQGDE